MAQEQFIKGTNVMLGPGANLARVPWAGRNFEYLGEDPVLAAKLVFAEILGIQQHPITGCLKHFVDNSQEYARTNVSENVPRRVQWELYYSAFASAVDAGIGSVMCSYNRINNTYACENPVTLNDLKNRMGFRGWVMSDWTATHSTVAAANNGLDQQMPDDSFFGANLAAAVAAGNVSMSRIDDMVMRILTPAYAIGLIDNPPQGHLNASAESPAHNALARYFAEQTATLLKNTGNILPLSSSSISSVGVFGDQYTVLGGGSGGVVPSNIISPFQGIYEYLNGPLPPRPPVCTMFPNTTYFQLGNFYIPASDPQSCCVMCSGTPGCNAFSWQPPNGTGNGTCWMKHDTSNPWPWAGVVSGVCAPQPLPPLVRVNVTYDNGSDLAAAAALAAAVEVAVVVVGTTSSEEFDRGNLSLPWQQDALVGAVVAANPNTIVVVRCPGACLMPWAPSVPAIVFQMLPGQEAGHALASVLFGDVNPSGKLPVSFPASMNDTWLGNPVNPAQYPGTDRGNGWPEVDYTEGLFMGYRWYDAQQTNPLWPFGHGLSYSNWTYARLEVTGSVSSTSNATVRFMVVNIGPYAGAEVVQMYIGYPAAAQEPPKLLKNFQKVNATAGSATQITFTLSARDLTVWDVVTDDWMLLPGAYDIQIGSSSRDIRLYGAVAVTV